ncbi:unnamed protein product, partial [Acidithrix sp. C25]
VFLIRGDDIIHLSLINSMFYFRPYVEDLVGAAQFLVEEGHLLRGEA